ncbi:MULTISPECIES: hypothetical protein [unclassified Streptomyces]|uniref:hypothetical protein n=1 Tax=unclassified Streptomyces TaxID=2593676 RepID=UPI00088B969D|nr:MULTISPECIES: hypothetical protein [unclassified Streptomyces]PBC86054.1 hypothetical protein BX261_6123 [Streptomyces sp. 2321.6]SDQ97636.1 hypothetical protein SAMN05216511_1132 [Streptomyces sp. KS_16]SED83110.1 hypothetical protein SAMN05428954_1103 [Streptomyces sp. 2112.3]SED87130.1 hypothetical protein SAMN05428940_6149 [Streptomyces sp. 2133.1]SNC72934.1 hypothetical protein SAMN06272741_6049 [Streptomyces sp. 2114.4]
MPATPSPLPPDLPIAPQGQLTAHDGRVEPAPGAIPAHGRYVNADLRPVPLSERRVHTAP